MATAVAPFRPVDTPSSLSLPCFRPPALQSPTIAVRCRQRPSRLRRVCAEDSGFARHKGTASSRAGCAVPIRCVTVHADSDAAHTHTQHNGSLFFTHHPLSQSLCDIDASMSSLCRLHRWACPSPVVILSVLAGVILTMCVAHPPETCPARPPFQPRRSNVLSLGVACSTKHCATPAPPLVAFSSKITSVLRDEATARAACEVSVAPAPAACRFALLGAENARNITIAMRGQCGPCPAPRILTHARKSALRVGAFLAEGGNNVRPASVNCGLWIT